MRPEWSRDEDGTVLQASRRDEEVDEVIMALGCGGKAWRFFRRSVVLWVLIQVSEVDQQDEMDVDTYLKNNDGSINSGRG